MENSRWSKFDGKISSLLSKDGEMGNTKLAKIILGSDAPYQDIDRLRTYIKRFRSKAQERSDVTDTKTNGYKKDFVLDAWNPSTGLMMDIETYCRVYNLPMEDIHSYKLVSHTGTPYYNIAFKQKVMNDFVDWESVVDMLVKAYASEQTPMPRKRPHLSESNEFTVLTYTDAHIGMDTDKDGNAMYPVVWDEEAILESVNTMIASTAANRRGGILFIDELGDMLDGWDAKTVRGGHDLPQNMSNEQAFSLALTFKVMLVDGLIDCFDEIVCNNLNNSNHSSSFSACLNEAFARIAEIKWDNVYVNNPNEFINHYFVGEHCFVISHGKDDKTLKFGFKPVLDAVQIEKIDQYLKFHGVFSKAKYITFKKGDSHQFLFDWTSAQDFKYQNYPALSPASQWVQTNFKRGKRGFVIETGWMDEEELTVTPIFL